MFIKQKRSNKFWIYEISDDKNLLLHYFDKEIEVLKFQSPVIVLIIISESDRIGFRKKLYKIFKKINKLANYHVSIGTIDMLSVIASDLERKI